VTPRPIALDENMVNTLEPTITFSRIDSYGLLVPHGTPYHYRLLVRRSGDRIARAIDHYTQSMVLVMAHLCRARQHPATCQLIPESVEKSRFAAATDQGHVLMGS